MAAATLSAAGAVIVFALAFALYALAEPQFGKAGAAAAVAVGAAILIAVAGLAMALARGGASRREIVSGGVLERAAAFVRHRPVVAGAAALAAGLLALRNPKYLGEAFRAFLESDGGG